MSKWFNSKKNDNPRPPVENVKIEPMDYTLHSQTFEKLDLLTDKMDTLTKKVDVLEDKLNRLIESNKLLLEYYSTRDHRDVNYMIRSYNLKNGDKQPINFVPSKTGGVYQI